MDKRTIRAAMRDRRQALSAGEQRTAAARLATRLASLQAFRASRRVAFYLPNDGEIDPGIAMALARRHGKCSYVPMLYRARAHRLWFAEVTGQTGFNQNRYGIREPRVLVRDWLPAMRLDLIFVPLVAFDAAGRRIGMGGGYYDRTLAFLRHRRRWQRPQLIGLAHAFQQLGHIDAEPWDVGLAAIVTDRGTTVAGGEHR